MAKLLSFMKSAVIFSLVFFVQVVAAAEFPPAPNPFHYINDYTNTLSSEHKQILENRTKEKIFHNPTVSCEAFQIFFHLQIYCYIFMIAVSTVFI